MISIHSARPLALLLALLLAPGAWAHDPAGLPNPECGTAQNPHDYTAGTSALTAGASPVGDTCAMIRSDRDPDWGVGAAFLPGAHHGTHVCVVDDVLEGNVSFVVGRDGNGDGLVTSIHPDALTEVVTGCVDVEFDVGLDGGRWVFVHQPATAGHVFA